MLTVTNFLKNSLKTYPLKTLARDISRLICSVMETFTIAINNSYVRAFNMWNSLLSMVTLFCRHE